MNREQRRWPTLGWVIGELRWYLIGGLAGLLLLPCWLVWAQQTQYPTLPSLTGTERWLLDYAGTAPGKIYTSPAQVAAYTLALSQQTMSSVAAPTGTANTTGDGVMMGLAGTITPAISGTLLITVSGDITNGTAGDGGMIHVRTGTGAAPSNAGALAGTTCGSLQKYVSSPTTPDKVPFSKTCLVTGAALNTALWIDVSLAAITGGTATIADVDIVATED
jgi:hypothetical protein